MANNGADTENANRWRLIRDLSKPSCIKNDTSPKAAGAWKETQYSIKEREKETLFKKENDGKQHMHIVIFLGILYLFLCFYEIG